ncbi:MAG: type II toxin-antitoxin system VapC family toxin, partial [Acidobacteriaceae bacterium]|nr:type II toxin-antitoxin system VapC family toxin [Acidobacteriaceae bacterium]
PKLFDTHSRLRHALELSLHYQLSLWDCVYLALAVEHNCPLITAAERLFIPSCNQTCSNSTVPLTGSQ